MTPFIIGAALTIALVLAVLLRPLWRKAGTGSEVSHREVNAAVYREQLVRLEQDFLAGTLSEEDHARSKTELQRQALEELREEAPAPQVAGKPRRTYIALGVVVPVAAVCLYALLGNASALTGTPRGGADMAASQADVEKMVAGLAAKLEADPSNLRGWALLGRSYKVMGRNAEAVRAYEKAGSFIDNDAQELANYADAVATLADGRMEGKPQQLVDRALKVDPANPMALWLAGTAAFKRADYNTALGTWEKLVAMLEPGSEDFQAVQGAIEDARSKGGKSSGVVVAKAAAPAPAGATVAGVVELSPALRAKAQPEDTVMVIARAPGSRMPVAVVKARANELPLAFRLDDSMAMSPAATLSGAKEVEVEARISRTGMAKAEPGDLISAVQLVKVGAQDLKLQVDKVRP